MNWTQKIQVPKAAFSIQHADQICAIGSCFADHIGSLMSRSGFKVAKNPNGIVFNPLSLAFAMDQLFGLRVPNLVQEKESWRSLDHHGSFFSNTKNELELRIREEQGRFLSDLKIAKVILITFGTAQVWEHQNTGKIVANCHRLPNDAFQSRMLTVEEIADAWVSSLESIQAVNPQIQFVFSVSPVRYSRGGAHMNSISKSTLHLAIESIIKKTANSVYFPAFEICIDELRDYRFFKEDYAHPSEQAVKYVYSKFQACFMKDETIELSSKIENLNKKLEHRFSSLEEEMKNRKLVLAEISNLVK